MKINLKNVKNALTRDEMRSLKGGTSCQFGEQLCDPSTCTISSYGSDGIPNSCCGNRSFCYKRTENNGRCCFY